MVTSTFTNCTVTNSDDELALLQHIVTEFSFMDYDAITRVMDYLVARYPRLAAVPQPEEPRP